MAIQSISTLKSWFVTLAKPVQSQFADWLDSFRHRSEKIGASDLAPELLTLINSLPDADALAALTALVNGKTDKDPDTGKLVLNQLPNPFADDIDIVIGFEMNGRNYYDNPDWAGKRIRLFRNGALLNSTQYQKKDTGGWILLMPGDILEPGQIFTVILY